MKITLKKSQKLLYGLICILSVSNGSCQFTLGDARSSALGNMITLTHDPWSGWNNPAGLAEFKGFMVGICASNRYLVNEMKEYLFTFRFGFRENGLSFTGFLSNLDFFPTQWYLVSYGRSISQKLEIGISLVYINHLVPGDRNPLHAATFKLGMSLKPTDHLTLSFVGLNPFGVAYKSYSRYSVPTSYHCGVSYDPSGKIMLAAELEMNTDWEASLKCGMEYAFHQRFYLRIGLQSFPFSFTAGAGLNFRNLRLDITSAYHSYLGFSPAFAILYHSREIHHEKE